MSEIVVKVLTKLKKEKKIDRWRVMSQCLGYAFEIRCGEKTGIIDVSPAGVRQKTYENTFTTTLNFMKLSVADIDRIDSLVRLFCELLKDENVPMHKAVFPIESVVPKIDDEPRMMYYYSKNKKDYEMYPTVLLEC